MVRDKGQGIRDKDAFGGGESISVSRYRSMDPSASLRMTDKKDLTLEIL